MDSNGTRFQLVLGEGDWQASRKLNGDPLFSSPSALAWDKDNFELTLAPRVFDFRSPPANAGVNLSQRRGGAADRFGNWYWIADSNQEIRVQSAGSTLTTTFWPATPAPAPDIAPGAFQDVTPKTVAALAFAGLTVTRDHYLVVGVSDPAGLLIFDLQHGGEPRRLAWPAGILFSPFDFSPCHDGGFWVLDRTNLRIWRLDRTFAVVAANQPSVVLEPGGPALFQPKDPGSTHELTTSRFPIGITLAASSPLTASNPIAIEALPDGSVLILDTPPGAKFSQVYRFVDGLPAGPPVSSQAALSIIATDQQATFQLRAHDFAYLTDDRTPCHSRFDTVYLVSENGEQAFSFSLSLQENAMVLQAIPEYLPLRLFGGKGLVGVNHQVYYDFQDRWIPLVEQRRPRYVSEGVLVTRRLDGKEPGCVWHRLLIDALLPPESDIEVFTRAHDDPDALRFQSWVPEPPLRTRPDGPEQPWAWQIERSTIDTAELLFQRARGRYLEIQLKLTGNGRSSPRLRSLRAYYPRFSYLSHYLPAVYREDSASASFLDRFLANFEGTFTALEDKLASVQLLLDPRSAPPDTLAWLANWFGVALDPAWTPPKRRLFLRHAMEFFEARGTIPGLLMALRLVLEDCDDEDLFANPAHTNVRIIERFRLRTAPAAVVGAPEEAPGLPLRPQADQWDPSQGAGNLDQRYRLAVPQLDPNQTLYPIRPSDVPAALLDSWRTFSRNTLGFVPAYQTSQAGSWHAFLSRRYEVIGALNTAYGADYISFDEIPLPTQLPRVSSATLDWYVFQAIVLRMKEAAHRFVVYLPMRLQDAANPQLHDQKLQLVKRVVDLEKPAHTAYDLKFFWAAFRMGEARLGDGTFVELGSRAPQLLRQFTLNDTGLGEGYLDAGTACFPRQRPLLKQGGAPLALKNCSCTEEENP